MTDVLRECQGCGSWGGCIQCRARIHAAERFRDACINLDMSVDELADALHLADSRTTADDWRGVEDFSRQRGLEFREANLLFAVDGKTMTQSDASTLGLLDEAMAYLRTQPWVAASEAAASAFHDLRCSVRMMATIPDTVTPPAAAAALEALFDPELDDEQAAMNALKAYMFGGLDVRVLPALSPDNMKWMQRPAND